MPPEIMIALEDGLARAANLSCQLTFPAGTTVMNIGPTDGVWHVYGWQYGDIIPGPPSPNFYIVWEQKGIRRFTDLYLPSVINFWYPEWLFVTSADPVISTFVNNTGVPQTIDFIAFIALFDNYENYHRWWECLVEQGYRKRVPKRIVELPY